MSKFSWPEYRRQQQQEQQAFEEASEKLHAFCLSLLESVSELELAELLEGEREWFAGDVRYQVNVFDQS